MNLISALVIFGLALACHCYVEPTDLPPELAICLQGYRVRSNDTMAGEAECFDQFVWKTHRVRWADYNVTEADLEFLKSLSGAFLHNERRVRRTPVGNPGMGPIGPMGMYPTTGFRIRREIRRLTDKERSAYYKAINVMKSRGQYDLFARIHTGIALRSAHNGPNFFSWHRIFLALFEEALRRINPIVAIPYWDTTLDYQMEEPVTSIIWSPLFQGNGDGYVRTGPFAGWRLPNGDRLTRDVNDDGTLLSRFDIAKLLTRCRLSELVYPTALLKYNADFIHGGPHNWVGGHMSGLNTAVADPTFWSYHAFIDYVWELFRVRQAQVCGVNPNTDIPYATGLHSKKRPMDGFPAYRGSDGYSGIWTRAWYRYEQSPTTCGYKQGCGSPYLRCDPSNRVCVSVSAPGGLAAGGVAGYAAVAARSDAEERTVRIGQRFPSPPPDSRTARARFRAGRSRRAAPDQTNIPSDYSFETLSQDVAVRSDVVFTERMPTEVIPSPMEQPASGLRPPAENTFTIDGVYDKSAWVYMPVKIISMRTTFASQFMKGQSNMNNAQCQSDVSGASQITVQSQGISYTGINVDRALIDTTKPVSVAVSYVAVKEPRDEASDVLVSAYGACLKCEASCLVRGSLPAQYKPCDGAVKVTSDAPLMFDKTVEGAAAIAWSWTGSTLEGPEGDIPIVFVCV